VLFVSNELLEHIEVWDMSMLLRVIVFTDSLNPVVELVEVRYNYEGVLSVVL